jgi:hypothetical protein
MSLVLTPYGIFGSSASEKFSCKPVKDSISSSSVGERVGKSQTYFDLLFLKIENGFELVTPFQTLFIFKVL